MANPAETSSPEIRCVFVETSLDTRLVLLVHKHEIISDFKEKLPNEHKQVFPEIGEINVSALKVERGGKFYHLSESMKVCTAFDGISRSNWFMYVDAVRVQKSEVLTIMSSDQNRSNLELVEKKKEIAVGSVLVDGMDTKDLTPEEGLETKVVGKKIRKRKVRSSDGKTSPKKSKVDVNQSAVATTELSGKVVQGEVASQSCGDDILTDAAIGKVIESGERNDVSMAENQQTTDADMLSEGRILTVVNSELVDGDTKGEVKDVPDNQTVKEALEKLDDLTGAIEQDLEEGGKIADIVMIDQEKDLRLASERETLGKSLVEAIQKETVMGEKSVEDVGRGNIETDKKKRRKSSKHHINQPAVVAVATAAAAENIQTDNLVSYQENQLEVSSGLTTRQATEKKKNIKKSSKHHVSQSTAASTTSKEIVNEREKVSGSIDRVDSTSESIPNLRGEKLADTLVDPIQNENEMGDKFVDKVGSREATLIDADKIQDANNLQVASLASTPTALVHESKTVDHSGKFTDENTSREHEVSKEKVEIDADKAKSVKSTKKKSSRRTKTPAKEETLVDSGAQNVEPIKVVDGEGPENVIRNVLDSLQQRNETEENLGKSGKKSSKSSKKKVSLNIVEEAQVVDSLLQKKEAEENLEKGGKKSSKRSKKKDTLKTVEDAQVLSVEVNNAVQEDASPINNPKDTDASLTLAKKDTENDASDLKKSIEVADNTEDNNSSKQIQKENGDMGDDFFGSQKDNFIGDNKKDEVTGGAKSKKEETPSGSVDGSVKPKERKVRAQPASSGTRSQLLSKDDRPGSKVDPYDVSVKGTVNNKKDDVKKSSNTATVNQSKKNVNNNKEAVKKSSSLVTVSKSKMNFFEDSETLNSDEDESETTSHVSTKRPSSASSLGNSSGDDSDVISMSRKQGNNLAEGTNKFSGSLQDIVRSSQSYKKAKLTASQSQPDEFDDELLS